MQYLDEIEQKYHNLKTQNEELMQDIARLKEFINSCNIPLEKLGNKLSHRENHSYQTIGKYLGKAMLGGTKDENFFVKASYKITQDLLEDHRKEIFNGFSNIFNAFTRSNSARNLTNSVGSRSFKLSETQILRNLQG